MLYSPTCVSFSTVSLRITLISFSWGSIKRLPELAVEIALRGFQHPDLHPDLVPASVLKEAKEY